MSDVNDIGGNQAEAFLDLPIQPRNVDFIRKAPKIAKELSKQFVEQIGPVVWTRFGDSRHSQVAICAVFDEESEFQVENNHFFDPGGKI